MTCEKKVATVADKLAALAKRVAALERQLNPTEPPVLPWWEEAYPEAYRKPKLRE